MADALERVTAYIESHITMTLATVWEGAPWAATLFYANDGLDLYFVSDLKTNHARAMLSQPDVFVTISQDYDDWQAIQGVQLRGRAEVLDDAAHARSIYVARFPFVASFPESFRYWRVRPMWARFVDNTQGFAHKDELTFDIG